MIIDGVKVILTFMYVDQMGSAFSLGLWMSSGRSTEGRDRIRKTFSGSAESVLAAAKALDVPYRLLQPVETKFLTDILQAFDLREVPTK
jgi:hypothetical protein